MLLFSSPQFIFAGDNARFRHYTTDDGLSENSVFSVTQDALGFMWFGTGDGLTRFDGYSFVSYRPDPKDSFSIPGNSVKCMATDKNGNVWVGTRSGLACYDALHNRFIRYPSHGYSDNGPAANGIMALAIDKDGKIWIATLDKGMSVFDPSTKKFSHFHNDPKNPNSLGGDDVRGLLCDSKGNVWSVTWSNGVTVYNPATGKFSRFTKQQGQLNYDNSRGAICEDKTGKIWIGSWRTGMDVWDPANHSMRYVSITNDDAHPGGMIWSLRCDHLGNIWVATAENGLYKIDPATNVKKNYMNDPDNPLSISDNNVWSLCEDRSGEIWAGTWQGGVNVYNGRLDRFTWMYSNPKDSISLPASTVWSFCGDGEDGIWIGTGAGPVHYDRKTGIYSFPPMYPADKNAPTKRSNMQSMCRQPNGIIWMGTTGGGVFRYDPEKKSYQNYVPSNDTNSIANNVINAIYSDEKNNLFVGAGLILQRFDEEKNHFVNYPFAAKDSMKGSDGIYVIKPKDENHLYVGTISGKLFVFDRQTRNFSLAWKSPANEITSLLPDQFGGLWIGTGGNGLFYFKDGNATAFTLKDGLPNNVINGIEKGDKDEIWVSTNHGICMFNPFTHDVNTFDAEDGLQGNEFNQNAYFRFPDGQIWFGGVQGITAFYPHDIIPNTTPSDAVITSFTVLNKQAILPDYITLTKDITLSWRDYFFSFEFAGLEFSNSARNQYKYMLEGFDEDWVEAGTRRFVTYTNLDPGEYTFRVMASNNDQKWNGKVAEIKITITPPFWKTKWFYSLCAVTILFSAWGGVRYRERALRKEKEVLEIKVSERTSELQQEKEKVTAAHKDIRDSINYAQRIQYALLAQDKLLKENLPEYFIVFKPKDVVSGDFYWGTKKVESQKSKVESEQGDTFYLAVCDSTGHGVPGAFMSLLNISFLNEAITEKNITAPDEVFNHVRNRLIENISQEGAQDGMDAILVRFDASRKTITYAAAHNAPVVVRAGEIIELQTDKMPVGKGEKSDPFHAFTFNVQAGDMLYLYTDGFADQFGGPAGKKFKETNLKKLLAQLSSLPITAQKEKLESEFETWKGNLEQVDDVLMVGIHLR